MERLGNGSATTGVRPSVRAIVFGGLTLLLTLAGCGGSSSSAPAAPPSANGAGGESRRNLRPRRSSRSGAARWCCAGGPAIRRPWIPTSIPVFGPRNSPPCFTAGYSSSTLVPTSSPTRLFQRAIWPDSWDISKDGLTYTFHLRDGVKWQNLPPLNGRKVTADDIVYSYNRFIKDGVQKSVLTSVVKDVKAVDDSHVAFTLTDVNATFRRP